MDQYLGEIRMFTWNWPPKGWALCNGAILPIAQNAALFSLLGTTYGGNGTTTFALPDLQGRVPIHRSSQYPEGARAGEEQVTLTQSTLPQHIHMLQATTTAGDKKVPKFAIAASSVATDFYYSPPSPLVQLNPASIGMVGGSQPHPNMQPFLVLNYCIAMTGIFPSRN
ncbi:MAG TPA: tail fiber protein [Pseudolabrys sp.]|jgi:microcystin-dependent protein|nr:tail fiber protein [Pseudolabrys sp.]